MSARNASQEFELDDADAGHALETAVLFGVPTIYLLVSIIGLVAGAPLPDALIIAIWPAIVGGPFFGMVVALGLLANHEHRPTTVIPMRAPSTRVGTTSRAA